MKLIENFKGFLNEIYSEETKNIPHGKELIIDFGKNMKGLSDELIKIGEKINELSKTHRVLMRDAFIDEADDVYQFKFVLIPLDEEEQAQAQAQN